MSTTYAQMREATGLALVTDYADDLTIPVLAGMQRQGDVIVIPRGTALEGPVVTECPVVRGESGGNTHAIYADSGAGVRCLAVPASPSSLTVAWLTVPEGGTAWLGHPEHGYLGIAPGAYEIRRQREMADELRVVAD